MLGKLLRHLSLRGERQDSGEKPVDNYVERGQKSPISVKWKSDMAAYKSPDSSVKWMSSKAACKNPNDADILDVTGMIILAQDNEDLAVRRSSDRNANLDSQVSVQSYHTAHELPMPSTRSAQVPPSAGIGTIEEDYISRRRLERERSLGSTHTSTSSSPDHSSTASHRQMSSRPRTPLASESRGQCDKCGCSDRHSQSFEQRQRRARPLELGYEQSPRSSPRRHGRQARGYGTWSTSHPERYSPSELSYRGDRHSRPDHGYRGSRAIIQR